MEHNTNSKPASFRFLDGITAIFITALIVSNVVASKTSTLFGFTYGVGIFIFPISYIFGDVLTEVYGYKQARKVIWLGFASAGFASILFALCDLAPPSPSFKHQEAFHLILGQAPTILIASLVAYFFGEFCNSYVLAKMKIHTQGKHLWARTIGSTVVGEWVDSLLFYPLAFWVFPTLLGMQKAIWPWKILVSVMIANYILKVLVEVLFTPVTYWVVAYLKKNEHCDVFDHNTDFNPFQFKDR